MLTARPSRPLVAEEEASEESIVRSLLNFAGRSCRRQAEVLDEP